MCGLHCCHMWHVPYGEKVLWEKFFAKVSWNWKFHGKSWNSEFHGKSLAYKHRVYILTQNVHGEYFCKQQSIREIHKHLLPQKFLAIWNNVYCNV